MDVQYADGLRKFLNPDRALGVYAAMHFRATVLERVARRGTIDPGIARAVWPHLAGYRARAEQPNSTIQVRQSRAVSQRLMLGYCAHVGIHRVSSSCEWPHARNAGQLDGRD